MMNKNDMVILAGLLSEAKEGDMSDFAETRGAGAKKIADGAKEKGGLALLTYEHFKVKLPYYRKAEEAFNAAEAKREYIKLCKELHSHMDEIEKVDQDWFQRHLGKMEVLGELLIQHRDGKA